MKFQISYLKREQVYFNNTIKPVYKNNNLVPDPIMDKIIDRLFENPGATFSWKEQ